MSKNQVELVSNNYGASTETGEADNNNIIIDDMSDNFQDQIQKMI